MLINVARGNRFREHGQYNMKVNGIMLIKDAGENRLGNVDKAGIGSM